MQGGCKVRIGILRQMRNEAFRAAANGAPAEAWGKCTEHGANPLHRLFGNANLTVEMLELVAGKVPLDAWNQANKAGGATPAHRLCAITSVHIRTNSRCSPRDSLHALTREISLGQRVHGMNMALGLKTKNIDAAHAG